MIPTAPRKHLGLVAAVPAAALVAGQALLALFAGTACITAALLHRENLNFLQSGQFLPVGIVLIVWAVSLVLAMWYVISRCAGYTVLAALELGAAGAVVIDGRVPFPYSFSFGGICANVAFLCFGAWLLDRLRAGAPADS